MVRGDEDHINKKVRQKKVAGNTKGKHQNILERGHGSDKKSKEDWF